MGQIWTIIFVFLVLIGWVLASRLDRADEKRRKLRDEASRKGESQENDKR